jgi:hypothetical protein
VPRLELWMTVFAGVAGGLAGVLWSGLVTAVWLPRAGTATEAPPRQDTVAQIVLASALRAAAGAVLGFMFWLSWGLIALVGLPWYAVGSIYGGLGWLALVVPALATLALRWPGPGRVVAAHAVEWLFTCLSIGLLCALAWHRYA